ncbi:MAG: phosphomannomutase/phosphoglucomutase [Candidatus Micrarchaeaceae archaeon]
MEINESIFRSYDIRGIYPNDINEQLAERIGKAFGSYIGKGKSVLVGRDVRLSSPSLSESLIKGLLSADMHIVYAGVIPSPLLYFAISHYKLDGGITVSASHNPPEWNGFKVCRENAHVIGLGSGLEIIREMVKKNRFKSGNQGKFEDKSSVITSTYLDFLGKSIGALKGLRIGIDPGNGAYSAIASSLFMKKGAQVYSINDAPDGSFPSRSPEPTEASIKELVRLVKGNSLDLGVAFDGDGDRVLFVTDSCKVVGGDIMLALLVKECLKEGEKVAYEVSCSSAVEDMINEKRGIPVLTKVGHSYMKESMKKEGCRFGGEISGHMYFKETYGGDDGLFAALKVSEMLSKSGKKLSKLLDALPHYENMSFEFRIDDNAKQQVMDRITERLKGSSAQVSTFEGIKVRTPLGWYLLRVSNTTPMIRCRVEAKTTADAEKLLETAKEELEAALPATSRD